MSEIVFQEQRRHVKSSQGFLSAICLTLLACTSVRAQEGPQHLPTIILGASFYNIKAEVAQTPQEHQIGLMHRTSMPTNEGMLFIFERAGQQCFWMKNTLIPLAVAFVDDDGVIVNLDEMKPETLNPHCSTKPVRFVLEMNTGWFTKRAIKSGTKLKGEVFSSKP
ncbi:MAG: DUF192 domain-containing protein [Pseudomonadota bacterium]